MSDYRGDWVKGQSVPVPYDFSVNGALSAVTGLAVAVYDLAAPNTPITAGVTKTEDQPAVGAGVVYVDSSNAAYVAGKDYVVRPTAGTVGGVSVVGRDIGSFSIEHRSAMMPTVAGRKLDVSAGGGAGLDWANVKDPQSAVDLTATRIATVLGNVNGDLHGLDASALAQIFAEVRDAIGTQIVQPGQGTPPADASLRLMVHYLYKAWRNKTTQTATQYSLFNDDAVTVDQKATFSDDVTTATRTEIVSGP